MSLAAAVVVLLEHLFMLHEKEISLSGSRLYLKDYRENYQHKWNSFIYEENILIVLVFDLQRTESVHRNLIYIHPWGLNQSHTLTFVDFKIKATETDVSLHPWSFYCMY